MKKYIEIPIDEPLYPIVSLSIDLNYYCTVSFARSKKGARADEFESINIPEWLTKLIVEEATHQAIKEYKRKIQELLQ